jgi:malate dehydrogenase (oxaloacetate-decarboxylating)(NADP+)
MINAAKLKGTKLKDEKYLFLGAGSAGIGLANLLCSALVAQGITLKEAQSRVYMFDINGLLESTRKDLVDFQTPYAHQHAPMRDFVAAIESIKPTTIIGVSMIGGAFNDGGFVRCQIQVDGGQVGINSARLHYCQLPFW